MFSKIITIPKREFWDEVNERFVTIPETSIKIKHSLVSISKWESKWHKAFLGKKKKTIEEMVDYIKCMTITQNVDPVVYLGIDDAVMKEAIDYIQDPMGATVLKDDPNQKKSKDVPTSELIYYWMVANQIPFECEKWHLNRLMSLIKICGVKNQAPKKGKRGSRAIAQDYARLNSARLGAGRMG